MFMTHLTAAGVTEFFEGYRQFKYTDTAGTETIGIGFNLTQGFTLNECRLVLNYRINNLYLQLSNTIPKFISLSRIRSIVLIDMAYNLGIGGLLAFEKMIAAINNDDFNTASDEMEKSDWFKQVGKRGDILQYMMKNDNFPEPFAKDLHEYVEKTAKSY